MQKQAFYKQEHVWPRKELTVHIGVRHQPQHGRYRGVAFCIFQLYGGTEQGILPCSLTESHHAFQPYHSKSEV